LEARKRRSGTCTARDYSPQGESRPFPATSSATSQPSGSAAGAGTSSADFAEASARASRPSIIITGAVFTGTFETSSNVGDLKMPADRVPRRYWRYVTHIGS